jgi:N-acetylglutamate synthase-like GNAT family acetyltransferase
MSLTIRKITEKADFKKFVELPFQIYKDNKYWVPPIKADEIKSLDPNSNPSFKYITAAFWLAEQNGKVVGRIGAIIHHKANELNNEKLCRLTRFECINDANVAKLLFETAEAFAKQHGMNGVHGPLGFSNLDHQAVLVEGFEELPSVASEYHMPYYQNFFEQNGYAKEIDWIEFKLKVLEQIPDKALRINEIIKKKYNLTVKNFSTTAEMKPYSLKIFHLLNTAFSELFSFVPMADDVLQFYINKYIMILNPKFVKVVEDKEGTVIGFIISLPSLSEAMQKANGKVFPFGWWHIKKALKAPKVADLLLTGVHPDWQAQGVVALLITELQQVFIDYGVKWVETTGMIETNEKAISMWKNYDHVQHKRKRCYRKDF